VPLNIFLYLAIGAENNELLAEYGNVPSSQFERHSWAFGKIVIGLFLSPLIFILGCSIEFGKLKPFIKRIIKGTVKGTKKTVKEYTSD
jgi:hypothetical protein